MKRIVNQRRNKQVNSFFKNPRTVPIKEQKQDVSHNANNKTVVNSDSDVQTNNNQMSKGEVILCQ